MYCSSVFSAHCDTYWGLCKVGSESFITGRNEVVAKVIFLHLFVILFTGGGFCLNACWDPPQSRPPSPWTRHPPQEQTPQTRHPRSRHPPRADTPLDQAPPWEADSSIRSMTGQYASYWNAFLFIVHLFRIIMRYFFISGWNDSIIGGSLESP